MLWYGVFFDVGMKKKIVMILTLSLGGRVECWNGKYKEIQ
jgi:hypothetical protein